jgi:1,4-dihydroxy-2-naphthoate octaprenyltransferase
MMAVGIGQGALAFMIGYLIGPAGTRSALSPAVALPALGAALVTLGLYPITQAYQVEEDRARGDRTLPVVIGWRRALWCSAIGVPLGGAWIVAPLVARIHPWWLGCFPVLVAAYWALLRRWAARFTERTPAQNHDWAMGIAAAVAGVCWVFIVIEWRRSGW